MNYALARQSFSESTNIEVTNAALAERLNEYYDNYVVLRFPRCLRGIMLGMKNESSENIRCADPSYSYLQ